MTVRERERNRKKERENQVQIEDFERKESDIFLIFLEFVNWTESDLKQVVSKLKQSSDTDKWKRKA